MTMADIVTKLRVLDVKHQDDGDGGYALLADVREYRRQLPDEEDRLLREELIRLVEQEDATLRGVALETLVQEWGVDIAQQLAASLSRSRPDAKWEGHLLLALLRLGYRPIGERAVEYVSQRLLTGDRTVFPLVAALARISKEQCLSIASTTIVKEIAQGNSDKLEGYVPAFVRNFTEVDLAMLRMLVLAVREKDASSGRVLANMLLGYLSRSYVQDELGTQVVGQLRESLIETM
jgi:hypothetical protein